MGRYILRRFGFLLMTLALTSILVFGVMQFVPGDVARIVLGREASPEAVAELRRDMGLDAPLPVQYVRWLGGFATGDWGQAFTFPQQPGIRPLVVEKLGNSLRLALLVLLLAVPLSLVLGIWAGLNENGWPDNAISIGALAAVGLPEFVTGLVLIEVFTYAFGWLPGSATGAAEQPLLRALPQLILPAITATLVLLAYISRLVRAGVIEELTKPYVRTATLKGLSKRVVVGKHVLRNALLPTVTVVAISFGWLVGGLIVIEVVFNYRGLGLLLLTAIERRDLPLIQAITMVIVTGVALANLTADLLYAYLNPRIRLK